MTIVHYFYWPTIMIGSCGEIEIVSHLELLIFSCLWVGRGSTFALYLEWDNPTSPVLYRRIMQVNMYQFANSLDFQDCFSVVDDQMHWLLQ